MFFFYGLQTCWLTDYLIYSWDISLRVHMKCILKPTEKLCDISLCKLIKYATFASKSCLVGPTDAELKFSVIYSTEISLNTFFEEMLIVELGQCCNSAIKRCNKCELWQLQKCSLFWALVLSFLHRSYIICCCNHRPATSCLVLPVGVKVA